MMLEIIFDVLILFLLGLSLFICLILLIFILLSSYSLISNIPMLLTFNSYLTTFFTLIMTFILYVYNLYGDLHPSISMNDSGCQLRTYLFCVCFCALYYSCVLKSIFRLIRIVFHQSKYLKSFFVFFNMILLQWFVSFLLLLMNLLNGDYQYLPKQYRCWLSFENIRGLLLAVVIIYVGPLSIILTIYVYIIRHIRRIIPIKQKRRKAIERDVLVFKRICIFIFVLFLIGLPTVSILFVWIFTGKLVPMAYHIQGLSLAIGLFMATISFAFISPQMQKILNKKAQIIYSSVIAQSRTETIPENLEGLV